MYVSEDTFVHLRHAADERLHRELEYRRVAEERAGDAATAPAHRAREVVQRLRRWAHPAPRSLSHP